jgi:pimeloyl-ACP methyl ester carboxylesterase
MRSSPRCIAAGVLLLAVTVLSSCATQSIATATRVDAFKPLPPVDRALGVAPANHAAPVALDARPQSSHVNNAATSQPYLSPERLQRGLTIVVVGVNGDNMLNAGLAPGLVEGGYPGAVEVVDWTTGFWPLFVYHLRADQRHETFARKIADKIVAYQSQYPGRPVNLVGHSAGAVVAMEAIEALPDGAQIDRAVLLAGAISPLYDLRTALVRTRDGVVSYYQTQDIVALWAGTLVAGTADGAHLPSAGAVGFWVPPGTSAEDRYLYRDQLVQLPYKPQMALSGNLGGHFQCVSRKFVAEWISPMLAGHPGHDLAQRTTSGLQ